MRMAHFALSQLLLVLLLGRPAAQNLSNLSYLVLPIIEQACRCNEDAGQGFSSQFQRCMKGTDTPCTVCPHQRKCADVETVVGDGIRAFQGDCRVTPMGTQSKCYQGQDSSLAFPVSIARDEADNLYIADFGNNRIRRWDAMTGTVSTIAGTGEIGFSGDGGPARLARLRQPEGIAVKPGLPLDQTEVYFSDFKNQRVRRVTLSNGTWIIDTVAGTGVKGDAGPECDVGCNASSDAYLNNPRALAFSSVQDLFLVDSGNRKIRKVTPDGIFSTLVGNGAEAPADQDLPEPAPQILPGHWTQNARDVSLGTLYFLNVDREDRVWFVDGPSPRVWKVVAYNRTWKELDGASGRMLNFYHKSFFQKPLDWDAVEDAKITNLGIWMSSYLNQTLGTVEDESETEGDRVWMYGRGRIGHWCSQSSREACKSAAAQQVGFAGINGFCFDAANNIFISDSESSELLYLNKEPDNIIAARTTVQMERMTTRNCPCFQYWFDPQKTTLDSSIKAALAISQGEEPSYCRENPQVVINLNKWNVPADRVNDMPACNSKNFCLIGDEGIEECIVGQADSNPSCVTGERAFCSKPGVSVSFEPLEQVAVLAGELRDLIALPGFSKPRWQLMAAHFVRQDLWLRRPARGAVPAQADLDPNMLQEMGLYIDELATSILLGFDDPPEHLARPPGCNQECCGLPRTKELASVQDGDGVSSVLEVNLCRLRSIQDTQIVDQWLAYQPNVTILVSVLDGVFLTESSSDTGAIGGGIGNTGPADTPRRGTEEDCAERCMLDEECTSYMIPFNETTGLPETTGVCAIFRQNFPYSIYTYGRPNGTGVGLSSLEMEARRGLFVAKAPYSRIFNTESNVGIYLSGVTSGVGGRPEGFLSGPHDAASLNLRACQDLCIRADGCTGIAFPGCFLLNRATIYGQNDATATLGSTPGVKSMVYVKKYLDTRIEGVAGSRGVFTYNGDDKIFDTFLNKPTSCVVSENGDVYFADMWNQRIRRITNFNLDCLNAARQGRNAFMRATTALNSNCTSTPRMQELYMRAQQEVVDERRLTIVENQICKFPAAAALDTDSTIVLCEICNSLWERGSPQRPAVCPWEELCDCTGRMAEGIQTLVYKMCPYQSAYHDRWHVWLSSFVHCLTMPGGAADYLAAGALRTQLENTLRGFSTR